MFTGRMPHELSADWFTPLNDRDLTLAEALRDRGYATAAFMANHLFTTPETGLDRGFLRFDAYRLSWKQLILSSAAGQLWEEFRTGVKQVERHNDRKSAENVNREFLSWLEADKGRPFFVVLNYFDAHRPYTTVSPYAERFGKNAVGRYSAAIAYLDAELGELFRELERRGVLRNTVVVVTSDHGELFGEGGARIHGGRPIYRVIHVPLIIVGPGAPAGARVSAPVSLRELPATIMRVIGQQEPMFPGQSLTRYWQDGNVDLRARPILSEARRESLVRQQGSRAPYTFSLVGETYHYLRHPDGLEQLFDYNLDPEELKDLAGTRPADLRQFRAALDSLIGGTLDGGFLKLLPN
jgi:arylsulfatase A-like enzyme